MTTNTTAAEFETWLGTDAAKVVLTTQGLLPLMKKGELMTSSPTSLWSPGAGRSLDVPHRHAPQRHLARGPHALAPRACRSARPRGCCPRGPTTRPGYWENKSIQEFDDELLAALGGAWDHPPVLAPGWEAQPDLGPHSGTGPARSSTPTSPWTAPPPRMPDGSASRIPGSRCSCRSGAPCSTSGPPSSWCATRGRWPDRWPPGTRSARRRPPRSGCATCSRPRAPTPATCCSRIAQLFDDLDGTLAQITVAPRAADARPRGPRRHRRPRRPRPAPPPGRRATGPTRTR